jgi:formylglycine-generating enzyme required for sulfatase activity
VFVTMMTSAIWFRRLVFLTAGCAWLLEVSCTTTTGSSPGPGSASFVNSAGIKMIRIQPGSFTMGEPKPKPDGWDEQPVHKVTFRRPFYISEMEVTVEQFQQFRPGFLGSLAEEPAVTGVSWNDAVAFCDWLSQKEGRAYRLPTEAEWEYAARAGTNTPFWSGDEPPQAGMANPWGLKNVHSGASEWCFDWYGPYPSEDQVDPIGPGSGLTRLIRGGGLDRRTPYYARSQNRASYAANFSMMDGTAGSGKEPDQVLSTEPTLQGLIGVWYGRINLTDPKAVDEITTLDLDWKTFQQPGQDRGEMWSARWEGFLAGPVTGPVTLHVSTDHGATVEVGGETVIDVRGSQTVGSGRVEMVEGKRYPIRVTYVHDHGDKSTLDLQWSWKQQERTAIPRASLLYSPEQRRQMRQLPPREFQPGHHSIGFRIVQAELPSSRPWAVERSFVQQCVTGKPIESVIGMGPDPAKPWYRRRFLLPVPPYSAPREETRLTGMHPSLLPHMHNPGLEVLPNGDLLAVLFASEFGPGGEDQPEVALIATRLRFGTTEWDMPEPFIDFADVNDTSAFLWKEENTLYCFWGHTFYKRAYPFQWISSTDNGAIWGEVHFPQFAGEIGPRTNQPINSAARDRDGTFYLPSDAIGGSSVLWASSDNMKTWRDTGGRTLGRHTTIALLKDGRILGMGGKTADINGYMPKSITRDGGKTWDISKTPFPALASGQRPTLLRLQSGRLFFAGDLQDSLGRYPAAIKERGAYVALSEDEGETWRIKKLVGTLPSDKKGTFGNPNETIGYSVARQARNGIIHMVTTKTIPPLHWELNEAWILLKSAGFVEDQTSPVSDVQKYRDTYPSGKLKAEWSGGTNRNGEFRLHGRKIWYYESGQKQWDVNYSDGRKEGDETYWNVQGRKLWSWTHGGDGTSIWTQFWPNGQKKAESSWKNFKLDGFARLWDPSGKLISERRFVSGQVTDGLNFNRRDAESAEQRTPTGR